MMIIPPRPWHSLALLLVTFITPSFGQAADAPLILRADVLLPGYSKPQPVSYEVRDGLAIFEGDIILGEVDGSGYLLPAENDINADAVATNQERYRWPDGVVPYEIDLCTSSSDTDCVTAAGEQNIKLAIDHWNNSTPIQLVERDPALHRHYVRFVRGTVKNACFSKIGRQLGEQKIQLTSDGDCHWVTLVHEIGHTVGLYHEHTREDRDDYVQIRWDNIDPKRKGDFEKRVHVSADSGAYDYYSVMHYDRFSFCKKTTAGACVGPTIDAPPGIPIGQTNSLSTGDLTAVSALYSFQPVVTQSTPVRCATTEICVSADVSGDGRDDLITFVRDGNPIPITPPIPDAQQGDVLVARAKSDGSGFESRSKWHESFCLGNDVCKVADVNGDGRGDLVAFKRTGEVQVARALIWGTFGPAQTWATQFCERPEEICDTGDFNGDGDADIVKFHHGAWNGSSQVYVYLSDGSTGFYYPGSPWANGFCMQAAEVCTTGDFNRDGRDDIITFHHGVTAVLSRRCTALYCIPGEIE